MAVSTKRKNSLKSKSNSKTRKQFKKFRKTKKNVRKMKGGDGDNLNVYSFKVIVGADTESPQSYPVFGYRIVYAKDKNHARTFIKDESIIIEGQEDEGGSFTLKGNVKGKVKEGETVYDSIQIEGHDDFDRTIKKLGIAPYGAREGIIDLDVEDSFDKDDE